jgi:hypothetical protein
VIVADCYTRADDKGGRGGQTGRGGGKLMVAIGRSS